MLTVNFQHRDLVRLVVSLSDVVEMHCAVVGDEADLSSRVARQVVELVKDRLASHVEVPALLGQRRDVHQKEIDRWLWWPQHVLRWRNEFDRARADLRTAGWIAVGFTDRIVLELLGDCEKSRKIEKILVLELSRTHSRSLIR